MRDEDRTGSPHPLLLLSIPFILILCGATIIFPVVLLRGGRNNLVAAIVFGIFGLVNLMLLTFFLLRLFGRAGRAIEPIMLDMGLHTERYLLVGRRYRGEYAGSAIEVEFIPPQWNRRALLNIRVAAETGTRIAFFRKWPPLDCANCPEVRVDAVELDGISIRAENPDHVHAMLSDSECRAALGRLFDAGWEADTHDLYVQPARIWLRTRGNQITETQLRKWIDGLIALGRYF